MRRECFDFDLFLFLHNCARSMENLPLRLGDVVLLNQLCRRAGGYTPVTLAAALGVSKPMITARLNNLVRDGYVVRMPSPTDGRSVYIVPTKKSVEVIMKIEQLPLLKKIKEKMGVKNFDKFLELINIANDAIN